MIPSSILARIGDTSLIQLGAIVPDGCARILLKVEAENPTGSMKDRMALAMIEAARRITEETGGFWADQLANPDQLGAYTRKADEIWNQTEGRLDAFVQSTGTCGSIRGVSDATSRAELQDPLCRRRARGIRGALGRRVGLAQDRGRGRRLRVSTAEAMAMARRLAKTEAIFAGTSTGGNVAIAIAIGERLGPEATVVTLMCDSGVKYLSTELYGPR